MTPSILASSIPNLGTLPRPRSKFSQKWVPRGHHFCRFGTKKLHKLCNVLSLFREKLRRRVVFDRAVFPLFSLRQTDNRLVPGFPWSVRFFLIHNFIVAKD